MHKKLYEELIENIHDGIYYVNPEMQITLWNRAAERITGYSRQEVIGSRCSDNILRHIDAAGNALCINGCPLRQTLQDGKPRENDVFLHHKDGYRVPVTVKVTPVRDNSGRIIGAAEIFSDNSTRQGILEELATLRSEVFADPLTGIGNRRFAQMNIESRLREQQEYGIGFGILFIDIDHFKSFNDEYGHNTGDAVLRMVAGSVSAILRKMDVLGRWGGEEFVALILNIDVATLNELAERVRLFVEESWLEHDGRRLNVTVSIGGVLAKNADTPESLVHRADQMMYRSKTGGRNRVSIAPDR